MTPESLITNYGYLAILAGTFLEGETVLILGGFFAHQGYLDLCLVILAAFAGSLSGDQLYFFLGRKNSSKILEKRPYWKRRIDKFQNLLIRFQTPVILIFRFLYGLRTIAPFVIGMSKIPAYRFVLLNAIGAFVWAVMIACAGFLFGHALEAVIEDIKHYEMIIIGIVITVASIFFVVRMYIRRFK